MPDLTVVVILSALILVFAVLRAWQAIRLDQYSSRGSEPGEGYHEIAASYHSGGGGGGQSGSFRVPKDPQTYAKLFIPEDRKND